MPGSGVPLAQLEDSDALMTEEQVAMLLSVHRETIRGWRRPGRAMGPRFFKLCGHLVRYRRADVFEWLREQKAGARA
jgi:excisionase family DNA binding protein